MSCWNPIFNENGQNKKNLLVLGGTERDINEDWQETCDYPVAFNPGNGGELWPYGTTFGRLCGYIISPDREYTEMDYANYESYDSVKTLLKEAGYVYDPDFVPAKALALGAPKGGEIFCINDTVDITWSANVTGSVEITLFADGVEVQKIGDANASDKLYQWIITDDLDTGTTYTVAIRSEDGALEDSSAGEFRIIDLNLLPQNLITIESVSSQAHIEKAAALSIDGNSATYWQNLSDTDDIYPGEIVYRLDKPYCLTAFSYLPQQYDSLDGLIQEYTLEMSSDGVTWEEIKSGSWEHKPDLRLEKFSRVTDEVQYVKLIGRSSTSGKNEISCAEFNLYYEDEGLVGVKAEQSLQTASNSMVLRNGILHFESNGTYELTVATMNGRSVMVHTGNKSGAAAIDFMRFSLARGIYVVELKTGDLLTRQLLSLK